MLEFRNLTDFSSTGTPSSGYYLGYDIDGKLKQKSFTGSIRTIGDGATGPGIPNNTTDTFLPYNNGGTFSDSVLSQSTGYIKLANNSAFISQTIKGFMHFGNDDQTAIGFQGASNSGHLIFSNIDSQLYHTSGIELNSPTIQISQLTGLVTDMVTIDSIGTLGRAPMYSQISISRSDIMLLIASSSLVTGSYYHLNDEADANSAYNGDPSNGAGIIIQAISPDKLSLEGYYIALNADYQSVGVYPSGVQLGVWTSILTPSIDDYVIWNNSHWKNLTGTNSVTTPPDDSINWLLATRDISNGYIIEIDDCQYDITNSNATKRVTMRSDKRGNVVYL